MSSTPNPLTRIEREARKQAFDYYSTSLESEVLLDDLSTWGQEMKSCYYISKRIAFAEFDRAAPVVKALEDRLKEWEASQEMERKTVDLINSVTTSDECRVPYPDIPAWVTQYKQILQTYKADV